MKFLGQPATKGMSNNNIWIYIERTQKKGKMLQLGKNLLTKNNTLVLEFNEYGILADKNFYNIKDMKKIEFTEDITINEIKKQNFIYSFLNSVRQKMSNNRK